jgi:SAM-dependent methyltransferase
MYKKILTDLRNAYDRKADERDQYETSEWKKQERLGFFSLLREEGKQRLLDVGAGTGIHGKYFRDEGLGVICSDLSYENARRCRAKGLDAFVMDFLDLGFSDGTFDAIFAMNCLLHVPKRTLPQVLLSFHSKLVIGGLFYWGQYGGVESEGSWHDDYYEPKRFYSLLLEDQIRAMSKRYFKVISSKIIETDPEDEIHFHSLILRR